LQDAYRLPQALRSRLARPLGRLFTGEEATKRAFAETVTDAKMVITVGDKVTETIYSLGRIPDIQVVDGLEMRMKRLPPKVPYSSLIEVRNPAGVLTREAILGVRAAVRAKKPARVLVEGEEDLIAIPIIALAPPSAVVFYGQPGVGIVAVKADGRAKARNKTIMAKMGIRSLANFRVG
jgi:uncharacterized protein (UPF0218 family)